MPAKFVALHGGMLGDVKQLLLEVCERGDLVSVTCRDQEVWAGEMLSVLRPSDDEEVLADEEVGPLRAHLRELGRQRNDER